MKVYEVIATGETLHEYPCKSKAVNQGLYATVKGALAALNNGGIRRNFSEETEAMFEDRDEINIDFDGEISRWIVYRNEETDNSYGIYVTMEEREVKE